MIRGATIFEGMHPGSKGFAKTTNVCGLLFLFMTPVTCFAAVATAYFTEPGSGRKVTSYTVDLPTSESHEQRFTIPDDCKALTDSVSAGDRYRGRVLGRRLWMKAEQDCRYNALLKRNHRRVAADYVSDYDFMNMRLDQLPYETNCESLLSNVEKRSCSPQIIGTFGKRLFFVPTQESSAAPLHETAAACQFQAGILRGQIHYDGDKLYCVDDGSSSLRILGVDYSDVNGDDVLDAVLRLTPLGIGVRRNLLILPVTRFGRNGPLKMVNIP